MSAAFRTASGALQDSIRTASGLLQNLSRVSFRTPLERRQDVGASPWKTAAREPAPESTTTLTEPRWSTGTTNPYSRTTASPGAIEAGTASEALSTGEAGDATQPNEFVTALPQKSESSADD